jgi:hypothetical protein
VSHAASSFTAANVMDANLLLLLYAQQRGGDDVRIGLCAPCAHRA